MSEQRRLLDKKTLQGLHPALSNRWTLDYLIRTRRIPFVKIGGRRIFFDELEISKWISENNIQPAEKVKRKG